MNLVGIHVTFTLEVTFAHDLWTWQPSVFQSNTQWERHQLTLQQTLWGQVHISQTEGVGSILASKHCADKSTSLRQGVVLGQTLRASPYLSVLGQSLPHTPLIPVFTFVLSGTEFSHFCQTERYRWNFSNNWSWPMLLLLLLLCCGNIDLMCKLLWKLQSIRKSLWVDCTDGL